MEKKKDRGRCVSLSLCSLTHLYLTFTRILIHRVVFSSMLIKYVSGFVSSPWLYLCMRCAAAKAHFIGSLFGGLHATVREGQVTVVGDRIGYKNVSAPERTSRPKSERAGETYMYTWSCWSAYASRKPHTRVSNYIYSNIHWNHYSTDWNLTVVLIYMMFCSIAMHKL